MRSCILRDNFISPKLAINCQTCKSGFPPDAAEVQDHLPFGTGKRFEGAVARQHDEDVRLPDGFLRVAEPESGMLPDVGLHDEEIRLRDFRHGAPGDLDGGGFPQVVDVRLERQAHQGDDRSPAMLPGEVPGGSGHFPRAPGCLAVVGLPGGRDHPGLLREGGGQEIRIDGDAVPADAAAGVQDVYARMPVGQADEFPDVDPRLVADERQLVGEGNLDVPAGIFRQFAHLGGPGRRRVELTLDETAVEGLGSLRGGLVDAPDDPVIVDQFVDDVAGQDPFRTVGYGNFPAEFRPLGEDEFRHLVRRADGGGGFDDEEVSFAQEREDRAGGCLYIRDVRLVSFLERGGDDDEEGVAFLGRCPGAELTFRDNFLQEFLQTGFNDVELPGVGLAHHVGIDVDAGYVDSVSGRDDGGREADVAESYETSLHVR